MLNGVYDFCDVTLAKDDGLKEEEMRENEQLRRLNYVCDFCDVTLAKDDGLKEEEMKENEQLRMCT